MKVVILAGGLGSRLSEETSVKPKPLVEVGDKPIIWHIMSIYAHHGLTDFIVCAGYKGQMLREYFANFAILNNDLTVSLRSQKIEVHKHVAPDWRVTIVDTGLNTMTGGRLGRIRHLLEPDEAFCLTYGDGVGDVNISASIRFHREHGRKATVCAVVPPARFGALQLEGNSVTSFMEKPQDENTRINAGFFVLEPSVLDLVDGDGCVWEREPLVTLAQTNQLSAYRHDGFWQPMDTLRERMILDNLWETGKAPWKVWS